MNPGEKLQEFLIDLYPKNNLGVIKQVDYHLAADGDIEGYTYMSVINYLVRRLISIADHYYRKYPPSDYGQRFKRETQNFLINHTRYSDEQAEEITHLLVDCIKVAKTEYKSKQKEKVVQKAQSRGFFCSTCGVSLEFQNDKSWSFATADHNWPQSMGGLTHEDNLCAVCKSCNNELKGNFIDSSDYHYEEISYGIVTFEDYVKARDRRHDLAIFAKTNYKCAVCDKSALIIGELKVGRINPDDGWHFFNLQGYCSKHWPKSDRK
jgi:hypothetical protein